MKISEIYRNAKKPVLSFEIFPPKPEMPLDTVFDTIEELKELQPAFISVTYGAAGSQKGRTVEIASRIKNQFHIESMAHLTCVGHNKANIDAILEELQEAGVENILALRGDPPKDDPTFRYEQNEFCYAQDLIEYIGHNPYFSIAAAAYPEGHRQCSRISQDWDNLKTKVDAGVDVLITQLFFDNRVFYHFLDAVRAKGIQCPIIPGIMPIFNSRQIKRIMALCGASMPAELLLLVDRYAEHPEDMKKAGVEYASKQIEDLIRNGVEGIHLEPMNKGQLAKEIIEGISCDFFRKDQ